MYTYKNNFFTTYMLGNIILKKQFRGNVRDNLLEKFENYDFAVSLG